MTAYEVTADERRLLQHEREFAGSLAPLHFEHAQARCRFVTFTEPMGAWQRETVTFGPRSIQRGAELLRKALRASDMVGIRDDDQRRAAQAFEMRAIVFTHRQWIDEDIAARSDPRHAAEVDVSAFIEARPSEEIRTV